MGYAAFRGQGQGEPGRANGRGQRRRERRWRSAGNCPCSQHRTTSPGGRPGHHFLRRRGLGRAVLRAEGASSRPSKLVLPWIPVLGHAQAQAGILSLLRHFARHGRGKGRTVFQGSAFDPICAQYRRQGMEYRPAPRVRTFFPQRSANRGDRRPQVRHRNRPDSDDQYRQL